MLLQLQDATVMKQNRKRVLDGVSLAIKEGEHTAILGPNGSGKSSLIKLITRQHYALVNPDGAPSMLIYGRARWNVFELRALLGIVSPDLQQMFTDGLFQGKTRGLDVVLSGFFASSGIYHSCDHAKALLNLFSYRIHRPELCLIVNGGLSNTCEDTCSPSNCRISISAPM